MAKKICYCATTSGTLKTFVLPCVKYLHQHTDWDFSFICSYDESFANHLPDFIHYYPVDMKRGISTDGLKVIRKMKHIFKNEKFDLVQFSTPNASLYASIAAKRARIPVRLYCQWGMVFVGYSGTKQQLLKKEEKFVCRNATWIEPDSKSNLAFARRQGLYDDSKSSVIWNGSACGINLKKFDIKKKEHFRTEIRNKYHIPDSAFVYIFVGRVNRDKGINELLKAYQNLMPKFPSYLFILGLDEGDSLVDRQLYQWSKKQNNIIYTGDTPFVEKYLAASDSFVLPSYREGFGMSVIEAQAMGLPVIVTDIPGPIDGMLKNETGLIVKKQNAEELQSAMERLYCSPNLRQSFGKAGVIHVKECFNQTQFFSYVLEDRKRLLGEA